CRIAADHRSVQGTRRRRHLGAAAEMIRMGRRLFALTIALFLCALAVGRQAEAQACAFTVDSPTLTFGDHQGFYSVRATSSIACSWTATASVPWLSAAAFATANQPTATSAVVNVQ